MNITIHSTEILATENGKTVGRLEFALQGNQMSIIHTLAYEKGKGIGTMLMQAAVQYANEHNYIINPICSFAQKYHNQETKAHK